MDKHSKEVRSYNMSQIKSKNSKPEEIVRKYLFGKGFRYRKNVKELPGCPDIVLTKYKTVIFVNGCFWHMHENCSRASLPASNRDYWIPKLNSNKKRDMLNLQVLKKLGWNVLVIWECELRKESRDFTLKNIEVEILLNNQKKHEKING
jgi:DNA mismatch endonuclease, patch repair protein